MDVGLNANSRDKVIETKSTFELPGNNASVNIEDREITLTIKRRNEF